MELFTGIYYGLVFVNCVWKYICNIETILDFELYVQYDKQNLELKEPNCFFTKLCLAMFLFWQLSKPRGSGVWCIGNIDTHNLQVLLLGLLFQMLNLTSSRYISLDLTQFYVRQTGNCSRCLFRVV